MAGERRTIGQVVAERVRRYRETQGLRQDDLAERTTRLGYPLSRVTIAKIEAGARATAKPSDRTRADNVSLMDVLVLAAALDVPPPLLLIPLGDTEEVRLTETLRFHPHLLLDWLAGDGPMALLPDKGAEQQGSTAHHMREWTTNAQPLFLFRGLRDRQDAVSAAFTRCERSGSKNDRQEASAALDRSLVSLSEHLDYMRHAGLSIPKMPEEWEVRMAELRSGGGRA